MAELLIPQRKKPFHTAPPRKAACCFLLSPELRPLSGGDTRSASDHHLIGWE